ncbi:MAG TPA: type II toxin-antitoxin system RelE/ParE family toxin [Bacillota bacterium]|nr:type II toxin-antitoxin system RelE/ParE family toxin [Bacillota bacterium]
MSKYKIYVTPGAMEEIKNLPGIMRHRVKRAIDAFGDNPFPSLSRELDDDVTFYTLRRLQIGRWRIIYAITKEDKIIDILGVRKRPPYDIGDLNSLLEELGD